jgi:glycosyltransferase involved in cell wall biosynthesis
MSNKPLVSVIIIFFNAEKFIEEAIESVFAQTYDNWELLLVDDGSTDASTHIARRYANQYLGKVRYIEHDGHQNRGMSASRNLGIKHANGKYIALLDSDDVWFPNKLEEQVEILETQPQAGMVYGTTQYWYSWTGNQEDLGRDFVSGLPVEPNALVEPPNLALASYPLGKGFAPCPSDLLVRREIIDRVGRFEEEFHSMYQMYEDQAFLAKVYLKESVYVSNKCWDRYRIHPDSCVTVVKEAGQYDHVRLFFLRWLEGYLIREKLHHREVWNALQDALQQYNKNGLKFFVTHALPFLTKLREGVTTNVRRFFTNTMDMNILAGFFHGRFGGKKRSDQHYPPVRKVRFGDLGRVTPISRNWGLDRGRPVDRYYIKNFLAQHIADIKGRVLEIGDDTYTQKYGGERVSQSDVLNLFEGNPKTTIVADLTNAPHIPSDTFDCIIFTQTLQLIYDVRAAIQTLYRILKPGGIILATFPGISQTCDFEWGDYWYWNFTTFSAKRLFEEVFKPANVRVEAHGNVLVATAFLQGLAFDELKKEELDFYEPGYEVTITVRAVKS